jgi:hypothetical protein
MTTLRRCIALLVLRLTYPFGQRAALPWRQPVELRPIDQGWPTPLVQGDRYRVFLPFTGGYGFVTLGPRGWEPLVRDEQGRVACPIREHGIVAGVV